MMVTNRNTLHVQEEGFIGADFNLLFYCDRLLKVPKVEKVLQFFFLKIMSLQNLFTHQVEQ